VFLSKLAEGDNLDPASSADINTIHQKLNEVPAGTAEHHALTHDQKELKKLAKRIVKAVKELTEGAVKKEAELRGLQHEETMRKIESLALFSVDVAKSIEPDVDDSKNITKHRSISNASAVAGASPDIQADGNVEMQDADGSAEDTALVSTGGPDNLDNPTPASKAASCASSSHSHTIKTTSSKPTEPLSPPISTVSVHRPSTANGNDQSGDNDVLAQGGVAWYLTPFDIVGSTVHEERYTGREVMRDMSEELSDMDEDTLMGLELSGLDDSASGAAGSNSSTAAGAAGDTEKSNNATSAAKKRPKRKRNRW
jgi:NuA3 HAT complex component NTO1